MDDVELTPVEDLSGIVIAGPQALEIVMTLGTGNHRAAACSPTSLTAPPQTITLKRTVYAGAPVLLIHAHSPLVPRFEIWSDASTIASILAELCDTQSLPPVSPDTMEAFRILSAQPRYSVDIRDKDLPQETNQTHALHFAKGCYLGQEIVERIRSRGQVHRTFTTFELSALPTSLPSPLTSEGKPAGEITSAATIPLPQGDRILALGYARREALDRNQPLTFEGGTASQRQT